MKFFLLICSIFFSVLTFANTNISGIDHPSIARKVMLVNQDQITFQENEIFVSVDNNWQKAESLESTPNGIIAAFWYWTCPNCGHTKNPLNEPKCRKCGWKANWDSYGAMKSDD